MKLIVRYSALALIFLAAPLTAVAQKEAKISLEASRSATMSAVVEAVNQETREVTLTSDGGSVSFVAGPEVRNLAQVEPGDLVFAEVVETVTVTVYDNAEGLQPGAGEIVSGARAELGAMPGGMVSDTMVITAVVEAIDLENNTFTLRGPQGGLRTFEAANPENLRKGEVGDLVVMTINESVGILVERPSAE